MVKIVYSFYILTSPVTESTAVPTCVINSVFTLREASCSLSFLALIRASISSKKITAGSTRRATLNNPFISFSPSPTYLLVTLEADILKNEKPDSVATAFANKVFPVPVHIYLR